MTENIYGFMQNWNIQKFIAKKKEREIKYDEVYDTWEEWGKFLFNLNFFNRVHTNFILCKNSQWLII